MQASATKHTHRLGNYIFAPEFARFGQKSWLSCSRAPDKQVIGVGGENATRDEYRLEALAKKKKKKRILGISQ